MTSPNKKPAVLLSKRPPQHAVNWSTSSSWINNSPTLTCQNRKNEVNERLQLKSKQTLLINSKTMDHFNIYKFIDLKQKLDILTEHWNINNRNLAIELLEEWCWTYSRQT